VGQTNLKCNKSKTMLKNSTVSLSFKINGVITKYGQYDYRERTTGGSILPEDQRLFVINRPQYSDCYKRVQLTEFFVNHAISDDARPDKNDNFKAFTFWRKMTDEQRLEFGIAKYVADMGGVGYNFQILEA
jgi:hypothetical protein